ncbi:MAG: hypothetical protein RID59_10505 [Hoeflea sp.]
MKAKIIDARLFTGPAKARLDALNGLALVGENQARRFRAQFPQGHLRALAETN